MLDFMASLTRAATMRADVAAYVRLAFPDADPDAGNDALLPVFGDAIDGALGTCNCDAASESIMPFRLFHIAVTMFPI
jgi:hypothetical protein